MKKIKNFFEKNIKLFVGILIGGVLVGGSVYAATIINASEVSYTNNSQTTVGGALDNLYTRAGTWINPEYIDFSTLDTNTGQTILASSDGVCIKRNNKVSCFKSNNWAVEKDHVQEVFSGVTCTVNSDYVSCTDSNIGCTLRSNGYVYCRDVTDNSYCDLNGSGNVSCSKVLGMKMNSAKSIMATPAGITFKRANGNVYFLGINNYAYEKEHVQEIFSDVGCSMRTDYMDCYTATDFNCKVYTNGRVICSDLSNYSYCEINESGSITCN